MVRCSSSPGCPSFGAGSWGLLSNCCGRGCADVETGHYPFGVRNLRGITRRWGGKRMPRGGTTHRCEGRLVSGALPLPAACSRGGKPGPGASVFLARVVRLQRPINSPTACALASQRCALWGWHEHVAGGLASRRREGRLWLGSHPLWLPVLGTGSQGSLSTCCGRRCAGLGTRHCPFGVRALRCIARRGAGGRLPGGGNSDRCEGRLVSGALPLPAACRYGGQPEPAVRVR